MLGMMITSHTALQKHTAKGMGANISASLTRKVHASLILDFSMR